MEFQHIPVLYNEVLEGLQIKPDGIYCDLTLGAGGDSEGILQKLGENGRLIATDKDPLAIENAKIKLAKYNDKLTLIHDDFRNIESYLDEMGIEKLDGIIIDLGVSSPQIDTAERGFSYMKDAPLDMRMDTEQNFSAYNLVNEYAEKTLADVLFLYGEEKFSRQIARRIVAKRQEKPIESTLELSGIIASCYPPKARYKNGNPAKRSFQAIRIEVNDELRGLAEFLQKVTLRLKEGGRICVISFHSLEDRIVKHSFIELQKDCICDKHTPICTCNKRQEVIIITKKPISGDIEAETNKRSTSAKLRIAERV
ncbi:MAG: 16S rRNA (cytosine(1402)-N(4))-methyltransferase RsmH [Clostridia bacterium]